MRYADLIGSPIAKEARLAPTRYVDQFAKTTGPTRCATCNHWSSSHDPNGVCRYSRSGGARSGIIYQCPCSGFTAPVAKAAKRFTNVCSSNSCQHVQDFATKREAEADATSHAKMNQNPYSPHDVSIVDNAVAKVFGEAKCKDCGTQYNDAAEGDEGRCEVCQDKFNAERYRKRSAPGATGT